MRRVAETAQIGEMILNFCIKKYILKNHPQIVSGGGVCEGKDHFKINIILNINNISHKNKILALKPYRFILSFIKLILS